MAHISSIKAEIAGSGLCPLRTDAAAVKARRSRIISAMRGGRLRLALSQIHRGPNAKPDPCETVIRNAVHPMPVVRLYRPIF